MKRVLLALPVIASDVQSPKQFHVGTRHLACCIRQIRIISFLVQKWKPNLPPETTLVGIHSGSPRIRLAACSSFSSTRLLSGELWKKRSNVLLDIPSFRKVRLRSLSQMIAKILSFSKPNHMQ